MRHQCLSEGSGRSLLQTGNHVFIIRLFPFLSATINIRLLSLSCSFCYPLSAIAVALPMSLTTV